MALVKTCLCIFLYGPHPHKDLCWRNVLGNAKICRFAKSCFKLAVIFEVKVAKYRELPGAPPPGPRQGPMPPLHPARGPKAGPRSAHSLVGGNHFLGPPSQKFLGTPLELRQRCVAELLSSKYLSMLQKDELGLRSSNAGIFGVKINNGRVENISASRNNAVQIE